MRQLGGIDSMFISAETPSMHLHVIGVMTIDVTDMRTEDPRGRVRDLIEARIPLLLPFRWRIIEAPAGIGRPRWIEDPDFDIDRHVKLTTLRKPGSTAELQRYVADVADTPLPRNQPLWEMHLVDGLASGEVAVVTKLHHAFMDGGAGAEVMASLFDLEADVDTPPPVDAWKPDREPTLWDMLSDLPAVAVERATRFPQVLAQTATGIAGLVGAMFPTAGNDPRDYLAPRTPYNGALGPRRAISLASCQLDDLKRVKSTFGVTVNDVLLAAVTSALRADLDRVGALEQLGDRPLVAAVPVSVRSDEVAGDFGNHTSAMMVPLPAQIADPVERLREIHRLAQEIKGQHQAMGTDLLEGWAAMFPPWLTSLSARALDAIGLNNLMPPLFNVIVSNVQGSPIPLYLAGAKVTAIYPLGPLVGGCGLNITVFSQLDKLHIGIIADPGLVKNPDALTAGVIAGIDELSALVPKPRKATTATHRTRTPRKPSPRRELKPEVR